MAFRWPAGGVPEPEPQECLHDAPGRLRRGRNPIYLFACHLEWRDHRNLGAYHELLAALDDLDPDIRRLAEVLLHRSSPNPKTAATTTTASTLRLPEKGDADPRR